VARIRCVLVGVDVYERPDVPRLKGCVNDVALVRRLLKDYFGVPNEDIRVIVNERATRDAIVHRLRTTIHSSEDGDIFVFYYSGHGSQIRDRNGDELSDNLDELICPYDMDWDRRTYILDDDLDEMFSEARPGVLVEAFFDCCFFGAGERDLGSKVPPAALRNDVRFFAPPFDIASRAEGDERLLVDHGFREAQLFAERNVLWSATAEGQEAVEDYFEGRAHGVFTYSGCRFIEENLHRLAGEEYTREQLLDDVCAYTHELGYPQSAELGAPGELRAVGPFRQGFDAPAWTRLHRRPAAWTRRPRV
jgi:metacaspase-1